MCFFSIGLTLSGIFLTVIIFENGMRKLRLNISGISEEDFLPVDEFIQQIKFCKEELFITDTFMKRFVCEDKWFAFQTAIETLLTNSTAVIRINLLSPYNADADFRMKELLLCGLGYKNPKAVSLDWIKCFTSLQNFKKELVNKQDDPEKNLNDVETRLVIKYFQSRPPCAMYSIDKESYISFYPPRKCTPDADQLQINCDSSQGQLIYTFFRNMINSTWSNGNDIEDFKVETSYKS